MVGRVLSVDVFVCMPQLHAVLIILSLISSIQFYLFWLHNRPHGCVELLTPSFLPFPSTASISLAICFINAVCTRTFTENVMKWSFPGTKALSYKCNTRRRTDINIST